MTRQKGGKRPGAGRYYSPWDRIRLAHRYAELKSEFIERRCVKARSLCSRFRRGAWRAQHKTKAVPQRQRGCLHKAAATKTSSSPSWTLSDITANRWTDFEPCSSTQLLPSLAPLLPSLASPALNSCTSHFEFLHLAGVKSCA